MTTMGEFKEETPVQLRVLALLIEVFISCFISANITRLSGDFVFLAFFVFLFVNIYFGYLEWKS